MALRSNLFSGDAALEGAATVANRHIMRGAAGPHVGKIQIALVILDGASIAQGERDATRYGASTAAAVLAYKQAREIINHAYQAQADDIVGVMTMKSLDDEMLAQQSPPPRSARSVCPRSCLCMTSPIKEKLHQKMRMMCQAVAR